MTTLALSRQREREILFSSFVGVARGMKIGRKFQKSPQPPFDKGGLGGFPGLHTYGNIALLVPAMPG